MNRKMDAWQIISITVGVLLFIGFFVFPVFDIALPGNYITAFHFINSAINDGWDLQVLGIAYNKYIQVFIVLLSLPLFGSIGIIIAGIAGGEGGGISVALCSFINAISYYFIFFSLPTGHFWQIICIGLALVGFFAGCMETDSAEKQKKRTHEYKKPNNGIIPETVTNSYGALVGIEGEYKDARIQINDGACIRIGRNAGICNLVLSDQTVSRLHCYVNFFSAENIYVVKDVSKYGVYDTHGKMIQKNTDVRMMRGEIIRIGKTSNVFKFE